MKWPWWQAARRVLFGRWTSERLASPVISVADRIAPTLSRSAGGVLKRRIRSEKVPPCTTEELRALVKDWSVGAGIAEGRGGYPGGSRAPGWSDYVAEQRNYLAIYQAATLDGDGDEARKAYFHDIDVTFTPSLRLLGKGYEPHIDEEAGRLLYGLPVDSGIVGWAFSFEVTRADFDVLQSDLYRRAVLEVVAHTVLQRSLIRGSDPVTAADFSAFVASVLHSSPEALARFLATVDRAHNIDTGVVVAQTMARRSQAYRGDAPQTRPASRS